MEIYLIRHTTPKVDKGVCYGYTDLDIASTFEEEAERILLQLPPTEQFTVYSSPLQRCTKLAKKINANFKIDPRLMELNFGNWENLKWDVIPKDELDPWMQDFVNVKVPGGESYIDLSNRVRSFFDELYSTSHQKAIIITHAGPMRAILSSLQQIALKDSFSIKINYADVIKI
ncbi:alpha-ribazole phosphatase [Aquimarina intermedia]|uniref:Alpha-ribazole phosphatase n=1 Tax=Aquimarina intermedia TaxID=350814 RepID=A0A5S5BZS8_9FLAO|nr:alpha-ribazole phosphatase [Aquimarina intermedia]TYP71706.1 alpha-ribazole phosphatase [Aquimarina intermedia]